MVLVTADFVGDVDCPFVVLVILGVDVGVVEWNELIVVDVIDEPNEKCGIVF